MAKALAKRRKPHPYLDSKNRERGERVERRYSPPFSPHPSSLSSHFTHFLFNLSERKLEEIMAKIDQLEERQLAKIEADKRSMASALRERGERAPKPTRPVRSGPGTTYVPTSLLFPFFLPVYLLSCYSLIILHFCPYSYRSHVSSILSTLSPLFFIHVDGKPSPFISHIPKHGRQMEVKGRKGIV